jgi:hypothetical protein
MEEGATREFQSALLPRYARRTREIDEAAAPMAPTSGACSPIRLLKNSPSAL